MPSITPSKVLSGGARGLGMQVKIDPDKLRQLSEPNAVGGFDLAYVVAIEGGGGLQATLRVRLDDAEGLFAGHSIIAVLGNLVSQVIEARLAGPEPMVWHAQAER